MTRNRDSALVALAKRGDDDAFRALFRDVQPLLLRFLRATTGPSADDIAAETWSRVVTSLDRFHGDEAAFRAWVFTIARHRRIDHLRARERDRAVLVAEPPETAAPHDVVADVMELVTTEAAVRVIAQLPPAEAEVVLLRVMAGLDVAAVAEMTGRRPGSVRVLAHRGLRRLGARLERAQQPAASGAVTHGEARSV